MNELFRDFLAESIEQLEALKAQLTEEHLADREACRDACCRIHAIKAACGLLNLPRLEALAHAAETLAASLGDVAGPKDAAASLMLEAIERMGYVVVNLAYGGGEGLGDDSALIARMEAAAAPSAVPWQADCDGPPLLETPVDQASTPPERRIDNLRIPLKSIERIDALVSDLIVTQNRLLLIAASEQVAPLREPLRRLAAIAGELQSEALAARLQPIGRLFANHAAAGARRRQGFGTAGPGVVRRRRRDARPPVVWRRSRSPGRAHSRRDRPGDRAARGPVPARQARSRAHPCLSPRRGRSGPDRSPRRRARRGRPERSVAWRRRLCARGDRGHRRLGRVGRPAGRGRDNDADHSARGRGRLRPCRRSRRRSVCRPSARCRRPRDARLPRRRSPRSRARPIVRPGERRLLAGRAAQRNDAKSRPARRKQARSAC